MAEFKTLARFTTAIEAEMVKNLLENQQITSYVIDSNLSFSLGSTLSQGIRLQVKSDDYPIAKAIYENSFKNNEDEDKNNLYFV